MVRKLGRGLDSLIENTAAVEEERVREIETDAIRPNPDQPREEIGEEGLEELAASIGEHGLLQPVLVRPVEGGYQLVAGERRWRAAQRAGLRRIAASVRIIRDDQLLEIALVENLQREDLNPLEKARAYRRYLDEMGLTHEEAARRLAKDRSTITNHLRLLELSDEIQQMVSRGTLSMGHARALLGVADEEQRASMARRIVEQGLSVRQIERQVKQLRKGKTTRAQPSRSAHFEDLERRLRERFTTKARIDGTKKKGRIVLEYYSMDELTRLLEMLFDESGT